MRLLILICFSLFMWSCGSSNHLPSNTYYVVRHAEKEMGTTMTATTIKTSDVPLSAAGRKRAEALRDKLRHADIKQIFSTNTMRTTGTAKPLSDFIHVPIQTYNAGDTSFINRLKGVGGNTLIIGHSNTVDDVVNGLIGKQVVKDLTDEQYGDLFIIKQRGGKLILKQDHFGK